MKKNYILIVLLPILYACNSVKLPTVKYNASSISYSQKIVGDSLVITLDNLLECPVRLVLNDSILNKNFERNSFVILHPKEKRTISVFLNGRNGYNSGINYMLGNAGEVPKTDKLSLPFQKGKEYEIVQGYNGNFSHNSGLAKYALDFNLKIGDTICAADQGFVVGLVTKYELSGSSSSWKDYSNFITIYNQETGVFTEYAHLKKEGTMVNIGDFVTVGQPIGISGMTGWTTVAHLHFVAYFRNKDWNSEPLKVVFIEGYKGADLKEKDVVRKL